MTRRPTVVSCGLCCASGTGAGAAYRASFGPSGALFRELGGCGLFPLPRRASVRVGAACGFRSSRLPRCAQILFAALDEALADSPLEGIARDRIGVYAGTSVGGILESENALREILEGSENSDGAFKFYECSSVAELVAKKIGARGECSTFSTACSSSSLALESACLAISEGRADAAVVCGADTLSRITVDGFGSLMLLSKSDCRPFDAARDGINLGEAGGVMVLIAREFLGGRRAIAEFLSFGSTCDAYHATAPHPQGKGLEAAISLCLKSGSIEPSEVSYYCAHGTGTGANDSAELAALRAVFGEGAPPYSSLKSAFGHTLGASGILNAIVAAAALCDGVLPPSAGYSSGASPEPIVSPQKTAGKIALSASLGFGGNNSCAAIAKGESGPKSPAGASARRIFVYGAGGASANPDLSKPLSARSRAQLDSDSLLPDIPVLKKRKWAKLQRMFLSASRGALAAARGARLGERACVSCATGLGMASETQKFLESVLLKDSPLPTAFTNSVHNAPSSAVAEMFGCCGYNCATTAKEVSFEAALMEARARIRGGSCDSGIVAGGDECDFFAENYARRNPLPAGAGAFADSCAAYFIGTEGACESAPAAEILALKIRRASKRAEDEEKRAIETLAEAGLSPSDVSAWFCPCRLGGAKGRTLEFLSGRFGGFEYLEDFAGRNYSASAFGILASLGRGAGIFAQYSLSSTSMAALTVWRVL